MRILGQIPHPELIIQVFKSGNKFILKFEAGPFEQSYKFMETERLSSFEDFKNIVTEELIREIYSIFDRMNARYVVISSNL